MKTLLVAYDLKSPGQDYKPVYEYLKGYVTYWHHLDSTWLIKTDRSAVDVRDDLTALADSNDKILVLEVSSSAYAWFGFSGEGNGGPWMKKNFRN